MTEKIKELIALSYQISNTSTVDVFVSYFPHINEVEINIYISGWNVENAPNLILRCALSKDFIYKVNDCTFYIPIGYALFHLKKIKERNDVLNGKS